MNNDLYVAQLDDAQELIGMAIKKLEGAQKQLWNAGHPGVRLANRKATELAEKLAEVRKEIDELPAPENAQ